MGQKRKEVMKTGKTDYNLEKQNFSPLVQYITIFPKVWSVSP